VSAASPRPKSPKRRSWLRAIAGFVIAIGVAGLLLLAAIVYVTAQSLPAFSELVTRPRGQSILVRGVDGSVLANTGPRFGEWLPAERIPETVKRAMVAVEDRRFYYHPGVDPIGISRAMWINFQAGSMRQGGSTLTQQVAKNVFLTADRTISRKLREMVMAMALEWRFSKDQILELYLNRVYFGDGAYGIDAASRRFYGHPGTKVSLEEAVILAGLVKAPTRYAPSSNPAEAVGRAKTVLLTMVDSGAISEADAAQLDLAMVKFARPARANNVRYFADWVIAQAQALSPELMEPIEIITTLDPRLQQAAEQAVIRTVPEGLQGGLVAMAPDGAIRAMMGGTDYVTSPYNRAVDARRQPGSAFKLFVYVAAIEHGHKPGDMVEDSPVTIGNWSPDNFDRRFRGPVSLSQAFASSINTVAVKLADEAGFGEVARVARRLGIATQVATTPAMSLGASEVSLLDLTSSYATIAAGGFAAIPYAITEIRSASGRILWARIPDQPAQVVSAETAADMTSLLVSAVNDGTGGRARIGRPAGGKTGTTSDSRDGWFVGFTAELTAGVWMGRDDNRPVKGLAGGAWPARAWAEFMQLALQGQAAQPLVTQVSAVEPLAEPDAEAYGLTDPGVLAPLPEAPPAADPAPEPAPPAEPVAPAPGPPARLDQKWLDKALQPPAN
jgi:penicillin-binding protein 1A